MVRLTWNVADRQNTPPTDPSYQSTRVLILVPTRELALQVTKFVGLLAKYCDTEISAVNVAAGGSAVQRWVTVMAKLTKGFSSMTAPTLSLPHHPKLSPSSKPRRWSLPTCPFSASTKPTFCSLTATRLTFNAWLTHHPASSRNSASKLSFCLQHLHPTSTPSKALSFATLLSSVCPSPRLPPT